MASISAGALGPFLDGHRCEQPYSASVFKISAMSFGALSANAVLALNAGAKRGNFAHDTGEGSMQVAELAALEPVAGLKVVHAV